jgi:hypothetical protein
MKSYTASVLLILILATACDSDDKTRTSGTDTINNSLSETVPYYVIGFNFASSKKVSSLANPGPDITVDLQTVPDGFILQTEAGLNGFFLAGEYSTAAAAQEAFNNLTAPVVNQWEDWASPVKPNQVWVYRSASEHYAKIRIVSLKYEARLNWDYAECTFEWVYQPDGTLSFPAR